MSVALLLEFADGRETQLIPIATQSVFDGAWLHLARALGLTWMPYFSTGCPVPREDLADVIAEFARFSEAADEPGVRDRAVRATEALRAAAADPLCSVWIG